jgi:LacI family transcriptional regulator
VAVAGFDDIPSAVDVVPALTTVAVPLREAGLSAIRLALHASGVPRILPIATVPVLRDSTPPLPPAA